MSEYVFKLPDLGEGTVESEIAEWMVKIGDVVDEEDTLCSMLTDKAAIELSSPVSGRVVSLGGEPGDVLAVGSPLIVFETDTPATAAAAPSEPAASASTKSIPAGDQPAAAATAVGGAEHKVRTSPSLRLRAREAGIDLSRISGSGERGRILPADLDAFLAAREEPTRRPDGSGTAAKASGTSEIKIVGLRRKIAERMDQANREIPHFAYVEEVDITALESLRQHLNQRPESTAPPLTLLPFIGLALVRVLHDFPQCNVRHDATRGVLVRHHAVHLGIATQTLDGLKVPVVRHAEARSLNDLAAEIRRVTTAARDNTATREELSGSTITITSLGKLGGIASTPIINLPEVAIVGVNKATERPMVQHGQVVIRRMMNLSSSFDHRFVDGHDGARMIQALKSLLEQPATLFMPA